MQPEPGIPHARALERAQRISRLRYDLHLRLPAESEQPVTGRMTLTFELSDTSRPLVIDFAPGHIVIGEDQLRAGENRITISFEAGDGPLNRREDLLYSIFVPARAHEAFPCFDQPDLKARWTLTLDAPAAWQVVSNAGASEAVAHIDEAGARRTVTRFAETMPIPTYLFAFAAGDFHVEETVREGRAMRLLHTGVEAGLVARNLDLLFDAHAHALRWLEAYTAIPYPFDSFDIVLIPAFQFSGMEHPGAMFYNAASLLLGPSATREQELRRASLIAHETAHLWFGDLVTMTWFDDVWMKEVCANFMAAKIVHPAFPDLDHDLRFLHTHYPGAYDVDRTAGTHPIRQPLANLADAGSLYGAIIYLKAPIVLRQLELRIGADALRDVLRTYLAQHAYGNASWTDLIGLLTERGLDDLREWSRAWIDEGGRPHISLERTDDDGRVVEARLCSRDARGAQRLDVAIGRLPRVDHVSLWFTGEATLDAVVGRPRPDFILPNGRGLGYGRFELDPHSRQWLLARLRDVPDALTRASAWLTLWEAMLHGEVPPEALLATALDAIDHETNELNLHQLLVGLERLFWIFTDTRTDAGLCADIEHRLRALVDQRPRPGVRAALLTTLRVVATTAPTLAWLQEGWPGDAAPSDLPIAPGERLAIALELVVRGVCSLEDVTARLDPALDAERRGFLAYVAPALAEGDDRQGGFIDALADPSARRPESWAIEALRWVHHPWRESVAQRHLRPCLDLLGEVARTGDIFLPKRGLDAVLSGHRSPTAATAVHAFLADLPRDYPPALRRMVLASADPLFRAAADSGWSLPSVLTSNF
ncbi:MAG: M1 family aminopeptidase [Vicinamibacterales bacterium]